MVSLKSLFISCSLDVWILAAAFRNQVKVITQVECINGITHGGGAGRVRGTGIACRADRKSKKQKRMGAVEGMLSHFPLLAGTQPSVSHP